jgi:hypothetical protein
VSRATRLAPVGYCQVRFHTKFGWNGGRDGTIEPTGRLHVWFPRLAAHSQPAFWTVSMDLSSLSPEERKSFNSVLDAVIKTVAVYKLDIPLVVIGKRFVNALESGERDPVRLRAKLLGHEGEHII